MQRCGKQKRMCASMCGSERVCARVCEWVGVRARVRVCVLCVRAWVHGHASACVCARARVRVRGRRLMPTLPGRSPAVDGGELGGHAGGVAKIEACRGGSHFQRTRRYIGNFQRS